VIHSFTAFDFSHKHYHICQKYQFLNTETLNDMNYSLLNRTTLSSSNLRWTVYRVFTKTVSVIFCYK